MLSLPDFAVRAAGLFDSHAAVVRPDPTVLVSGGRVMDVTFGRDVPPGLPVVHYPGATILPGLVDGHQHLVFDGSADPVAALAARDDEALRAAMIEAARRAVRGGVTTIRDLGDRDFLSLDLRDKADLDPTLPTIVAAGPPITTPTGHCHFLGGGVEGARVRDAVRMRAERGVDVIKVMASGGMMTPGTQPEVAQFTAAELAAVVDEAHSLGLPVVAHVHGTPTVALALAAGVDGLEHVSFLHGGLPEPAPDDVVAAIGGRDVSIGVLAVYEHRVTGPLPEMTRQAAEVHRRRLRVIVANNRRLHAAGADMIGSTDAGVHRSKPHDALPAEVPAMAWSFGMTAAEALRAATAGSAAACRLGDRKGRVAPGYDADLLIVGGDPAADLAALDRIEAVYVRGVKVIR